MCAPTRTDNGYTCYAPDALRKLRDLWNARHPDARITATEDRAIWAALREAMQDVCRTEECWLRQQFAKNKVGTDISTYTFAPKAPKSWVKNPREWLNSLDIERVMRQYERKHRNFVFIGPSPIDFDTRLQHDVCVWEELCKFDLAKLMAKGKNAIGIIFNVDPHDKPGAHWVSMFVDTRLGFIVFFDSTGDPPQRQVKTLIKRIQSQAAAAGLDFDTHINKANHQLQNTECGIYSLYLITELLQGTKTPEDFLHGRRIPDKEMFMLRDKFFNVGG